MALATTCPQCQTSFKVVPEQLKLRRGLVRCGVCQHVFSGIDHLRYVSEPRPAPQPSSSLPPESGSSGLKTAFFLPETIIGDTRSPSEWPPAASDDEPGSRHAQRPFDRADDDEPVASDAPATEDESIGDDLLVIRRRSRNAGRAAAPGSGEPDLAGVADDDPAATHDDFEPPTRARPGSRQRRIAIAIGALAVLLVLQFLVGARDLLAARMPAMRPLLAGLAAPLGLQVELPRAPGRITIESFELTAGGTPGTYRLDTLLRNRASYRVQWPAIELTLTDAFGGVLASRVLLPADYLAGDQVEQGLAADAERSFTLAMAIDDVIPNGYRATLFYP